MKILLTVLAVIFSIILFVFILLLFPFTIYVDYKDSQTSVDLRWLFIKKRLFPAKKAKKKSESKKSSKPDSIAKSAEKHSSEPFYDQLSALLSSLSAGGRVLKLVLSLHSANIDLAAKTGGEDAADIAVQTGKLSAYLHSALAALSNFLTIKKRSIAVFPDYLCSDTEYVLHSKVWIIPIRLLFNAPKILPDLLKVSDIIKH